LFGLSDDPAAPAPGLARLVEELGEHACGLPGALLFFLGLAHFLGDLSPQAFVPCKAKNVVHVVLFAPSHQFLTAEPGVRSQDDLRMRPGFPNLRDDALQFFYAPGARIDVRRP
jgi:hypothetical protein